ncbi:alpha/beta fold hydrolase [Chloroflexota bacterium]
MKKGDYIEESINIGAVNLHYVEGPQNGLPLVLIPGQGLSLDSYQRSILLITKHFQVFAVDIRGHGKSSWTPGQYNFNNMGKDIELFLKKVVKQPAIISGNSSGGLIAL